MPDSQATAAEVAQPADSAFEWTDAYLLGHPQMDDTHREFVALVDKLLTVPDALVLPTLKEFKAHAEQHFSQEDQWMVSTAFPPRDCHIGEHAAVLNSVVEVCEYLEQGGNVAMGRDLAEELRNWFPGHADYLDAALAQWLTKKAKGGAPVVLRRNPQTCSVPHTSEDS